MSKYREEFMESLTKNVKSILEKPEKTDEDKIQLLIYQKELARYERTPILKSILGSIGQVVTFLNKFQGDKK